MEWASIRTARTAWGREQFGISSISRGLQHMHARPVRAHASRQAPGPREVVVGIDLGTTNSAVAYVEGGKPRCIPNAEGARITPSVVSFLDADDVVVGRAAKRLAATNPGNTFYSVKRIIGRKASDPVVQDEAKRVAYKVSRDDQGQVTLQCSAVDRGYLYPEEVSAMVLAQLLDDAQNFTGGEVRKAVISVPAYFDNAQRDATANAGKLAGLEVVRIIREPVAAALAYGLNLKEDQTVLVFDLGGGTYDISLLEVGNGTIEVLSTGGDPHLGGDDWDAVLADWITTTHLSKARPPVDPSADPKLRAKLRALAEAAKMGLSANEEVQLRMPVGGPDGGPLEVRLSRAQFEQLCEPLWRRARLPLDQACWVAGVDLNALVTDVEEQRAALAKRGVPAWKTETMRPEIRPKARSPLSKVLLVGGATRMPAVASFIRNMTGLEPEPGGLDPDEAVALGAAVQAGILQGQVSNLMVMDQWQASLMRALAKRQLKHNAATRAVVEQRFDMDRNSDSDRDEDAEALREEEAIIAALDAEDGPGDTPVPQEGSPGAQAADSRAAVPGNDLQGSPARRSQRRPMLPKPQRRSGRGSGIKPRRSGAGGGKDALGDDNDDDVGKG